MVTQLQLKMCMLELEVMFTIKMTLNYPAVYRESTGHTRTGHANMGSPIRRRSIHFIARLRMVGALISWWLTEAEPDWASKKGWRILVIYCIYF